MMKCSKAYTVWRVLVLCLAFGACVQPVQAQISKLDHADTTAGNFFGVAVSVDGDRVVVGASAENVCGDNSGAAYILEWDEEQRLWREAAKLVPDDCDVGRFFGRSVSISGNRVLIGSAQSFFATEISNAAYLFELDSLSGTWTQVARLTGDPAMREGAFGSSVSLNGDRALVTTSGDPSEGQYHGAAYIFERDPRTHEWRRTARLVGSGELNQGIFGGSGDLDGNRIVVAASTYFRYRPGSVYIFERDPQTGFWSEAKRIPNVDDFFISADLDGNRLIVGESRHGRHNSGIATIYTRSSQGEWTPTETIRPRSPYEEGAFGAQVSLSGDRALVVGYDEQLGFEFNIDRVVYSYVYNPLNGEWEYERVFDIGEVAFGSAIDHNERWAIIGDASQQRPGAAYIVRLH